MGVLGMFKTLFSGMFNIVVLGRTSNMAKSTETNDLQYEIIQKEARRDNIQNLSRPSFAKAA